MKKFLSLAGLAGLAIAAVALVATTSAQAADFIAPIGDDGTVTINQTEAHHNLYVAGGDVSVNGPVTGDLYAAGGWVSIDGPVEQDLVVAGGTVIISEPVNGDVRVAGGKVTINAPVKGDVLAGAGTLVLTDKASVGGELRVSGGSVTVNAPVEGGAFFMGGHVTLNSKINGAVKVTASNELVFGPNADIASEVSYIGSKNAVVNDGAKVSVSFTELKQHQRDRGERTGLLGFLVGSFVIKFLATALAGLLCLRLFRPQTQMVAESMFRQPWANLGIGFVAAIVMPIGIVIALVIVVGYYIALVAAAAYFLAILAAGLLAAIFLGAWIVKLLTKKPHLVLDWQAVVIGTVVLFLLGLIPVVGWLVCALLFLIAFGALVTAFRQFLRRSRGAAAVQPSDS
jgi:cytoskeletal protein CcmA (bactofilin family)